MNKKRLPCTGCIFLIFLSSLAAAPKQSPIYTNLRESPVYAKTGFDIADTARSPDRASGSWQVIDGSLRKNPARVIDFDFSVPKRRFLSPFGTPEMEFTYVIPFSMSLEKIRFLKDSTLIPGFFFAGLGDNWEIYLNGQLIRREMHLDAEGHIKSHRGIRKLYFPVDKTLFVPEANLLAFRVVGDPNYDSTGFFYSSLDYIDDYALIAEENTDSLTVAMIAIYIFMGIYHLFMFVLRRKDQHTLYYGLLSIILGLYFFARTTVVYSLIPDTGIVYRLEFFCLFSFLPLSALFVEYFSIKRIFLITKIYSGIIILMAISQLFFSLDYGEDTLLIWQISLLVLIPIICVCDIGYLFTVSLKNLKKQYAEKKYSRRVLLVKTLLKTPFGNLTIGILACLITGIIDVVDFYFMYYGRNTINYGFTVFTMSITLILAQRLSLLYNQQERIVARSRKCMNAKLVDWIMVRDHDPGDLPSVNTDTTVMMTDIRGFASLSEGMPSQSVTGFLIGLNEALAQPLFAAEDRGYIAYTDKFMGDATMNIFTDPQIALETAVKTRLQLQTFNKNPALFFKDAPAGMRVEAGIGLASGPVTLGVMGHSRRLDYTPIGDTVNLASRLESLTKEYHIPILINDALYRGITPESFYLRHIDRIRVKGKNHPFDIYEEFSCDAPDIRAFKIESISQFQELQEMYFSGNSWEDAIRLADSLSQSGDFTAEVYSRRMKAIFANPELFERWDGIYTFNEK
jgi:class 3 adenylate cyclase